MKDLWEVEAKGECCSSSFEISVIRKSNEHGHRSFGWFDDTKLLISHNGGPCRWPLTEKIWDKMIVLAEEVAAELNAEEER
jgi:hypothetical protein